MPERSAIASACCKIIKPDDLLCRVCNWYCLKIHQKKRIERHKSAGEDQPGRFSVLWKRFIALNYCFYAFSCPFYDSVKREKALVNAGNDFVGPGLVITIGLAEFGFHHGLFLANTQEIKGSETDNACETGNPVAQQKQGRYRPQPEG